MEKLRLYLIVAEDLRVVRNEAFVLLAEGEVTVLYVGAEHTGAVYSVHPALFRLWKQDRASCFCRLSKEDLEELGEPCWSCLGG